ncbi:MAG: hypothetical protein U0804_28695 [Gemmataceae bacterium]
MNTIFAAILALWLFLWAWLSTNKAVYQTGTSSSGGLTSLASSSTFLAGYEWFVVDNTTELALDYQIQGNITVGTTPTANTEIRLYVVASFDGSTWPDVFDGTASAETVTNAGVMSGFMVLAKVIQVTATTSNVAMPFSFTVASLFGGTVPKKFVVYVAHNTGVNLNATAGNHTYLYTPYDTTNSA